MQAVTEVTIFCKLVFEAKFCVNVKPTLCTCVVHMYECTWISVGQVLFKFYGHKVVYFL